MNQPRQKGNVAIFAVIALVVLAIGFIAWRTWDSSQQAPTANNEPAHPQTDPNAGYIVIREWGVRFKPVEGLTGVQYFKPKNVTTDAMSITTKELGDLEPECSAASDSMVLGMITRSKDPDPQAGGVLATIGGYNFQYRVSGAACATDSSHFGIESQTVQKIIGSLKSLEAAK
ncbi:MAG TPA: hypothetical protein VLA88_03140 [Candidatus Saccharimonadales bacterium]|nr:hypothetical protein [Candidatus Saccharimonadales bacterium]